MRSIARIGLRAVLGSLIMLPLTIIAHAATSTPYQLLLNKSCPALTCAVDFPAVPAGKRLEITSVTCAIRVSYSRPADQNGDDQPIYGTEMRVIRSGGTIAHSVYLVPELNGPNPNGIRLSYKLYFLSENVFAFATASQHFEIFIKRTAGTYKGVACSIGGKMVTL